MPQILEMKEIDGELWCRVGKPGEFPNGVALWTPKEQEKNYNRGFRDGYNEREAEGE